MSYCFDQCGLIPDPLPKPYVGCQTEIDLLKQNQPQTYHLNDGTYIPQPGDIVFFDWCHNDNRDNKTPDGRSDHTGIIVSYEGGKINTIEGNVNGNGDNRASVVREGSRKLGGVLGYFSAGL